MPGSPLVECFERACRTLQGEPAVCGIASGDATQHGTLEQQLEELCRASEASWPTISYSRQESVHHLGACSGGRGPAALPRVAMAKDLWLAAARSAGVPAALSLLSEHYIAPIAPALSRLKLDDDSVQEVLQKVRLELMLPSPQGPRMISNYSGKGPLRAWLKIIAVRIASRQIRDHDREVPCGDEFVDELTAPVMSAELTYLKQAYREQFRQAFREGLQALPLRHRVLLKQRYLDGLNIDALAILYEEARAMARFSHPNIVSIFEVGTYRERPYLALEYVTGGSLARRLARGPIELGESLGLARGVASALMAAHGAGMLHSDLKPSNVLVDEHGRARVGDFGLALAVESPPSAKNATKTTASGEFSTATNSRYRGGTPRYMAPELFRGERPSTAADMWSFGVLLHELLCGRSPFVAATISGLRDEVATSAPFELAMPETLPKELRSLVASCLERDPEKRPTAALAERALDLEHAARKRPHLSPEACPFVGLFPFGPSDAPLFFGREQELTRLTDRLTTEPAVLVIGPSGVGKTSFLCGGLIPREQAFSDRRCLYLRPGATPFAALTRALSPLLSPDKGEPQGARDADATERGRGLARKFCREPALLGQLLRQAAARSGERLLLVVDQLEELYTPAEPAQQAPFVHALLMAAENREEPVRLVLAMRDDYFYQLLAADPTVAQRLSIFPLTVPADAALRDMLCCPVQASDYHIEDPALVEEILAEAKQTVGTLPLLSFAGRDLWEQRDRNGRVLTRAAYQRAGGVALALSAHAESVLAGLTPSDRPLARSLLLALVTSDGARRVQPHDALLAGCPEAAARVLEHLINARLITPRAAADESDSLRRACGLRGGLPGDAGWRF